MRVIAILAGLVGLVGLACAAEGSQVVEMRPIDIEAAECNATNYVAELAREQPSHAEVHYQVTWAIAVKDCPYPSAGVNSRHYASYGEYLACLEAAAVLGRNALVEAGHVTANRAEEGWLAMHRDYQAKSHCRSTQVLTTLPGAPVDGVTP